MNCKVCFYDVALQDQDLHWYLTNKHQAKTHSHSPQAFTLYRDTSAHTQYAEKTSLVSEKFALGGKNEARSKSVRPCFMYLLTKY